jgi:hypothetical protein
MYLLDGCNFPMFEYLNNFRAKISVFLIAKNSSDRFYEHSTV